jgi:LacI family transcriptional regulator
LGTEIPTIYDVAAKADVSVATVSRHINGTANLNDKTRKRVQKAIDALGFVPNATAQSLSTGRTRILGLVFPKDFVVPDDSNVNVERESVLFLDGVLRGIELESSENNYSVLISFVSPDQEDDDTVRRMIGTVDGLMGLEAALSDSILDEIGDRVPMVVIAGEPESSRFHSVYADNATAMRDIATHLATEHQITEAAFVSGRLRSPDARDRRTSFFKEFSALGGRVAPYNDLSGDWSVASGIEAIRERLTLTKPLPEAIVCANDQMAFGVINELKLHGIDVPRDVVVTGFDDTPMSLLADPPMTSVRQDTMGMGRSAVRVLLAAIEDPTAATTTISLPTSLVVRNSCGCNLINVKKLVEGLAS